MQDFSFQIIPVIDLMHGQVVHAKHGQRDQYLPIKSMLCATSEPLAIANALMKLYPFQTLYIADIDAIQNKGNNNTSIEKVVQTYPNTTFWLDSGSSLSNLNATNIKPVIGSENIQQLEQYLDYENPHVLSLDYNQHGAMGIAELHVSAKLWPEEVICMTLTAVGSKQGTDLKMLNDLIKLNQSKRKLSAIYAAGGVRNMTDIKTLASMAISGALIATALHHGQITNTDIANFYAK